VLDTFSCEYNYYIDTYASGINTSEILNTIYSRDSICYSTADYNIRNYYHLITNSDGNDTIEASDSTQVFNTLNYPNGVYIFRIVVSDPSGNVSVDSMVIRIRNPINDIVDIYGADSLVIYPNPSMNEKFRISLLKREYFRDFIIYDDIGRIIQSGRIKPSDSNFDLEIRGKGIYKLCISDNGNRFTKTLVRL
jgi:hypothetical protein